MVSVLLTTTAPANDPVQPWAQSNLRRLQYSASVDVHRKHNVVLDVADADLILFVGAGKRYHGDVKRSPLFRSFPEKCFIYDEQDNSLPSLRGVYNGLPRHLVNRGAFRSGFYLRVFDNPHLHFDEEFDSCKYLYCFQGAAANAPVRKRILSLNDSRGWIRDSSFGQGDGCPEYGALLRDSKFVLCPRGLGASSWRLFETMRSGRVPVIVSDDWTPPTGPSWHDFAVRVAEADCLRIPEICRQMESGAPAMGRLARQVWEDWFSAEAAFHRVVEWCLSISFEMQGVALSIPSIFMPVQTFSRLHFASYWKEFLRDSAVACGVWPVR